MVLELTSNNFHIFAERRLLVNAEQQSSKPAIQPVEQTDLLSRLQQFLPQMQAANANLKDVQPLDVDIEHEEEGDHQEEDTSEDDEGEQARYVAFTFCRLLKILYCLYFKLHPYIITWYRNAHEPYVELDLACGIFDLKDEAAVTAAEKSLINTGQQIAVDDEDSDDSEDELQDASKQQKSKKKKLHAGIEEISPTDKK